MGHEQIILHHLTSGRVTSQVDGVLLVLVQTGQELARRWSAWQLPIAHRQLYIANQAEPIANPYTDSLHKCRSRPVPIDMEHGAHAKADTGLRNMTLTCNRMYHPQPTYVINNRARGCVVYRSADRSIFL